MISYTLVGDGDEANIVVFASGQVLVAHSSHPNFAAIVDGAQDGDESIVGLFDIARTVGARFERLSERVTTANGRLYLDGEEIHNALAAQVLRFMDEGREDWRPLVAFFENVQANPSSHSREQLFSWLDAEAFTITPDGLIVGYKGVRKGQNEDGSTRFESINRGRAIVDGETHDGAIPNHVGAVVEMPRSEVTWDPANGCSRGLHVGTYAYASGFAQGALLQVHVNPRDVVSVPTDCGAAKMRTCRYTVARTIDAPHTSAVYDYASDDAWGDGEDDGEGWEDDYSF